MSVSGPGRRERHFGLLAQGVYYLLTGAWAVVHRRSFEAVSGAKSDYWLVRTVGALTTAVGASLLVGARSQSPDRVTRTLAAGTAAAFTAVDGYYARTRRISRVYLLDLAAQAAFLALALRPWRRASVAAGALVPATVLVDGDSVETSLRSRPPVGAKLDIGFSVIVTQSKEVDGGFLVAADRIDEEVPST